MMFMKKSGLLFWIICFSFRGIAQTQEIEQLKLDLEKLVQMKMMLQSMYDGNNTLVSGYNQVSSLAKGNFDLHKNYLDQLLQVAPQIRSYPIVQTILDKQSKTLTESVSAYTAYVKSGLFKGIELFGIKSQFDQYKSTVSKKLDQLNLVLSPGALRMSDQERLLAIDRIDRDVGEALNSVRTLVKEQNAVAAVRGQQKKDNNAMRAWYGLKQ